MILSLADQVYFALPKRFTIPPPHTLPEPPSFWKILLQKEDIKIVEFLTIRLKRRRCVAAYEMKWT